MREGNDTKIDYGNEVKMKARRTHYFNQVPIIYGMVKNVCIHSHILEKGFTN